MEPLGELKKTNKKLSYSVKKKRTVKPTLVVMMTLMMITLMTITLIGRIISRYEKNQTEMLKKSKLQMNTHRTIPLDGSSNSSLSSAVNCSCT
jgi:nucleoside diphosphate kinase